MLMVDAARITIVIIRAESLHCAGEVAASEPSAEDLSNRFDIWPRPALELVEQRPIAADDSANVISKHVEHELVRANARRPQFWQEFGSVDRPRVQQSVSARRVGRDGECVAGRIGEFDVRMLLDAEIATRFRL